MSRNNLLLLLAIICISGILYFVWTTQGSSINYLSESLELSASSVQRVYVKGNFYWKIIIKIHNIGQTDVVISNFYVSGSQANTTAIPPPVNSYSVDNLSTTIKPGESKDIEIGIDSGCVFSSFNKVTVSAYSNMDKMYNLVVHLI
jgi:hypothetical protein